MRQTFEILTAVYYRHTYFHNGLFSALKVSIPPWSAAQMQRNGILLKPILNGFQILREQKTGQKRSRDALSDDITAIRFHLDLHDPLFYNYTAGNYSSIRDHVFYFSNENSFPPGLLHPDEVVNEQDLIPVNIFPHPFFVKPFGVIVLQLHQDIQPEYNVRFSARALHWRYVLMSDSLRKLIAPGIIDTNGQVSFTGPKEVLLPDNSTAQTFTSEHPVSLQQNNSNKFQLIDKPTPDKKKIIIPVLPGAAAADISAGTNREDTAEYKEIFLY